MDVGTFSASLLKALASLGFVEFVNLHTGVFILKGRILLDKERFLQVYYNERTETTAFALIEEGERLWGIDYDALRGWHAHPVDDPTAHRSINALTVEEIVGEFEKAWRQLP